ALDRYVLSFRHRRQCLLVFERLAVAGFACFLVERLVAREFHDASGRAEHVPPEIEVHGSRVEHGRRHLRRHEALPHQLVKLELVILQIAFDGIRPTRRIGGTYGFVRVLRVLALVIAVQLRTTTREKLLAEQRPQIIARCSRCRFRDTCGIGTHVSDETHGPFGADLDALVQILRQSHRALGAEAEPLGRFLLQGAGRERRVRVLATLATLDFRYGERLEAPDVVENALRFRRVGDFRLLSVDVVQLCREFLTVLLQQRRDRPVLYRLECTNLALALDDEPQCDSLHAPRGCTLLHGLPQHRARLVTDKTVEHATRELRLNQTLVDLSGVVDRRAYRITRYLVEQHASDGRATLALYL